jgi:hypothetical protein
MAHRLCLYAHRLMDKSCARERESARIPVKFPVERKHGVDHQARVCARPRFGAPFGRRDALTGVETNARDQLPNGGGEIRIEGERKISIYRMRVRERGKSERER